MKERECDEGPRLEAEADGVGLARFGWDDAHQCLHHPLLDPA
jgi:hypothetical protein